MLFRSSDTTPPIYENREFDEQIAPYLMKHSLRPSELMSHGSTDMRGHDAFFNENTGIGQDVLEKMRQKDLGHADGGAVSNALRLARKPRATGGASDYSSLINDLYYGALGRDVDTAGGQFWQDQLSSGRVNAGDLAKTLLGTDEAKNFLGTSLDDLYRGFTGNAADEAGKQFWTTQIAQGNSTLSDVQNALATTHPGVQYQLPDMQVGTNHPIPMKYLNQLPKLIEKAYSAQGVNPSNYKIGRAHV